MAKYYSRLASTEERKNTRKAILFVVLTFVAVVALIFLGLPLSAKFIGFVTSFRKSAPQVSIKDIAPPGPANFNEIPDAVNKPNLDISGNAEPEATVVLSFNDSTEEVVVTSDGTFTFSLNLKKGENTIVAKVKDPAGNESVSSDKYTVLYLSDAPSLEITSPSDRSQYFGTKQQQVAIKGKTDFGANLTINDRWVKVADDGTFSSSVSLNEGDNTFNIKATDKAGTVTEKDLTLTYSN
jgi:hypothetical protein